MGKLIVEIDFGDKVSKTMLGLIKPIISMQLKSQMSKSPTPPKSVKVEAID